MWSQTINEIEAIKSNSSTIFEKNIAQDKIDFLKSLKDRYTWKPSEEQMRVLEQWLKNKQYDGDSRYVYPFFQSLYEQLKQL